MSLPPLYHRDIRRWSPDEDARLTRTYPLGLEAAQAEFPYRRPAQILGRAKKLGLSRAAAGPKRNWTGADEAKLRQLWCRAERGMIEAAIPGRSWAAITSKAAKLGLSERPSYLRFPVPTSIDPLIEMIGQRLRERGLTFTDLDEMSGIGRNVSGPWFRARSRPGLNAVRRAVEALGGTFTITWEND